jgi:hypothetical protein
MRAHSGLIRGELESRAPLVAPGSEVRPAKIPDLLPSVYLRVRGTGKPERVSIDSGELYAPSGSKGCGGPTGDGLTVHNRAGRDLAPVLSGIAVFALECRLALRK